MHDHTLSEDGVMYACLDPASVAGSCCISFLPGQDHKTPNTLDSTTFLYSYNNLMMPTGHDLHVGVGNTAGFNLSFFTVETEGCRKEHWFYKERRERDWNCIYLEKETKKKKKDEIFCTLSS